MNVIVALIAKDSRLGEIVDNDSVAAVCAGSAGAPSLARRERFHCLRCEIVSYKRGRRGLCF